MISRILAEYFAITLFMEIIFLWTYVLTMLLLVGYRWVDFRLLYYFVNIKILGTFLG